MSVGKAMTLMKTPPNVSLRQWEGHTNDYS
ncbi:hypothetical protein BJ987_004404 [Nocardia goodfellowii]|uniref:Uncharacterized protein n=1 Tax=Nocardia goodfellowii TaxID=882446 RepID=A0ABS4QIU3_9NOCA|nr:hypothetical protein [Nocardia goodfellowii]